MNMKRVIPPTVSPFEHLSFCIDFGRSINIVALMLYTLCLCHPSTGGRCLSVRKPTGV